MIVTFREVEMAVFSGEGVNIIITVRYIPSSLILIFLLSERFPSEIDPLAFHSSRVHFSMKV